MEKIKQNKNYEQENTFESDVCPPLVDVLKNTNHVAEIWPDYADQLCPQVEHHAENAQKITEYLDDLAKGEATMAEKQRFYEATSEILRDPERERIALFLPFESFPTPEEDSSAAREFRQSYLNAWVDLLQVQDVRANFVDGDVLEVDARSSEPERVVKAAHLAPWLVQSGMIAASEILAVARDKDENELLVRNFLETGGLLDDFGLLTPVEKAEFEQLEYDLPSQTPVAPPKYISLARRAWLAEKARGTVRPKQVPSGVDLGRPMSERLPSLEKEISMAKNIASHLNLDESYGVVWLTGSRLKGYHTEASDLDIFVPVKQDQSKIANVDTVSMSEIRQNLPMYAPMAFNSAWIGDPENVGHLQRELMPQYYIEDDLRTRKATTEYLERGLLEYRLLHKGYPRLYPDSNPEYKPYTKIDGQSSFYETGYRIIATKIYANSVFVPRIKV